MLLALFNLGVKEIGPTSCYLCIANKSLSFPSFIPSPFFSSHCNRESTERLIASGEYRRKAPIPPILLNSKSPPQSSLSICLRFGLQPEFYIIRTINPRLYVPPPEESLSPPARHPECHLPHHPAPPDAEAPHLFPRRHPAPHPSVCAPPTPCRPRCLWCQDSIPHSCDPSYGEP